MLKIINTILAFLFALTPILIVLIIGLTFYVSYPATLTLIIIGIFVIVSILVGINIFKVTLILGPFSFLAIHQSSPDLDNLKKISDKDFVKKDSDIKSKKWKK